jgi:serine protease Do
VELRDAIVFIDAGFSRGSGIRISSNEILTAQHVVGSRSSVNVSVKGEGLVFATIVGYDSERDVALLTFDNRNTEPVARLPGYVWAAKEGGGLRPVEGLGDEAAVVAYAPSISETTPIITFGRIGVIWSIVPGDIRKGQIDAPVTSGMSGGGVFNRYGELVGMLLSTSPTFEGNARYLSFQEITEVIGDLRSGEKV